MLRKTKLVCTIGPASNSASVLEQLVRAGMNVARLNLSYGAPEEYTRIIETIRHISVTSARPLAILLDLPGTKLRTGPLAKRAIQLEDGQEFALVSEPAAGNEQRVSVNHPEFFPDISAGDTIFLNDGAIQLKVISATRTELKCKVVVGGTLTAGKGINVPGVKLRLPSVSIDDAKYVAFAREQKVDFIGVSFVRAAADIVRIRQLLPDDARIPLIAKIEKHEAVTEIDSIIDEADGVMVARGDLGIEIPLEKVPLVQKEIVRRCNQAGKPVIVATQMLESMINAPRPTRAEVTDVANAIFDGADAVMLSGETAVGKYPVPAVEMMSKIVSEAETALPYERMLLEKGERVVPRTDDAISFAACNVAQRLGAACIVAYTTSGSTALRVSRYRPRAPVLAITPNDYIVRRLMLSWGVEPYLAAEPRSVDRMFDDAAQLALRTGIAHKGELIVLTAGIPTGRAGTTDLVKVHEVK